jgi:TonB family protein
MRKLTALCYALPLLLLWPSDAPAQGNAPAPLRHDLTSVAVSPDGRQLATGSLNRLVTLWDAGAGARAATLRAHSSYVYAVAFSPDGQTLASGGGDLRVRLWDAASGRALNTLGGHQASIETLAFSPDGRTLASGDHFGVIKLWEFASGRELGTLDQAGRPASRLAFSADGKFLASGGDGDAFVWEVATARRLGVFNVKRFSLHGLALSPDGRTAAAAGCTPRWLLKVECSVRLWDAATGRERRSLGVPSEFEALAFSRDGKLLAGVGPRAAPRLWDPSTGAKVGTLEEVRGTPHSLAFDDGAQRLTGSFQIDGGPARVVWDVGTRRLAAPPVHGLPPLPPMERPDAAGQPSLPTAPVSPDGGGGLGPGPGVGPGRGTGGGVNVGGGGGGPVPVDYNRIFRGSEVTVRARVISKPEPGFTEKARMNYIVGQVRLRAVLASTGEVTNIVVLSELPYFLTDRAVWAARHMKFVPATKDGRPVSQWVTLEYNFNIY